jgi:hypothetical protein
MALLAGALVFPVTAPFAGESRSWPDTSSGKTELMPAGTVSYSVGHASIGYDHFETEITVSWHDGGERTQLLFSGVHDRPPAQVIVEGEHLCVVAQYCERHQETCSSVPTCYRYDVEQKQFVEEVAEGDTVPR